MHYKRILTAAFLLLGIVLLSWISAGCGDEGADRPPNREEQEKIALTLEPLALEIEVGVEYRLQAVCPCEGMLLWESDAPQVVSVENGRVIGLKEGQAVVSVACGDDKRFCTVTVKERKPVLSIPQAEYVLTVDDTADIALEYDSPQPQSVVWHSQSPETVSVDEAGRITAIAVGDAEIVAEAEGLKASCKVKVLPKAQFVYLSQACVYMKSGDVFSLRATVDPVEALQEVEWESADASVVTVSSDGKIKAIQKGYAVIAARVPDTDVYATCEVYVVPDDFEGTDAFDTFVLLPNQTMSLDILLAEVGATDDTDVTWESSDPLVAEVSSQGVVTALGYGAAVITVINVEKGATSERGIMVELVLGGEDRPNAGGFDKPLIKLPSIMLDVPYIKQNKVAPTGCESASATMVLQHFGFNITLKDFIDTKLDLGPYPDYRDGVRRGPSPWVTFPGNPKTVDGYGCYAPAIVLAMQRVKNIESCSITYGYSVEASGKNEYTRLNGANFVDTSDMTVGDLCLNYLTEGTPIVLWGGGGIGTKRHVMDLPRAGSSWYIDDTDELFTWTAYEHCLVLVGCDEDNYYFNDPLTSKKYRYTRISVEKAFAAVYSQFVVLEKIEG